MEEHQLDILSRPVNTPLKGKLKVPGDKSISHRALMLAAIASGESTLSGLLESEDTSATMSAFRDMGIDIEKATDDTYHVVGAGQQGLSAPGTKLNFGNSGTSVRLMSGLLSAQSFDSELIGDASLMKRPMRRIVEPLQLMNADIHCSAEGTLPIVIHGGRQLSGIQYEMPVASAQLKSSLLLAGLHAAGQTSIKQPAVTRDHTERMLTQFGCPLEYADGYVKISRHELTARRLSIPGDISSAAFFMVAACIVPGSDITLENVGVNPTRNAIIEILMEMGANIMLDNHHEKYGEPVADIRIKSADLCGIRIPERLVPVAIDEFPAILIAAANAEGNTILSGAAELRIKESDRIRSMVEGLSTLGIEVHETPDGMELTGGKPGSGEIDSFTDHRIAMAFSIAGAVAEGEIYVRDCTNINTSYPGFLDSAGLIGLDLASSEP